MTSITLSGRSLRTSGVKLWQRAVFPWEASHNNNPQEPAENKQQYEVRNLQTIWTELLFTLSDQQKNGRNIYNNNHQQPVETKQQYEIKNLKTI